MFVLLIFQFVKQAQWKQCARSKIAEVLPTFPPRLIQESELGSIVGAFQTRHNPPRGSTQEKTPGKGDSQVQSYGRGKRAREVFIKVEGGLPICFIYSANSADSAFRIINVIPSNFLSPYSKMLVNHRCGHIVSSLQKKSSRNSAVMRSSKKCPKSMRKRVRSDMWVGLVKANLRAGTKQRFEVPVASETRHWKNVLY